MNDEKKMMEIDNRIGYSAMKKAIMEDGAIDRRTKKLLAVASAVAVGCDACFAAQVKHARNAGISDEEIDEAILVAALLRMGSGINYTWKVIDNG